MTKYGLQSVVQYHRYTPVGDRNGPVILVRHARSHYDNELHFIEDTVTQDAVNDHSH